MALQHFTLNELADRIGGGVSGDGDRPLTGIASLASAGPDELTFVQDDRRVGALAASRAGAAIVPAGAAIETAKPLLRVENVEAAVAALLGLIGENEHLPGAGVHASAIVAGDARMGADVGIGPAVVIDSGVVVGDRVKICANSVIGPGVAIGDDTVVLAGTLIEARSTIGRRCRIGPGAIIGASGFGYYFDGRAHRRVPHTGTVEIGDDVDIAAGSCVDRAKFGATRIGDGTKIDNLVQVAHNVQVGRGCLLAAHVGIGGSTVVRDFAMMGGHAGIRDNVVIGTGARIGAFAAIHRDIPDGTAVLGYPAIESRQFWRNLQNVGKIPDLLQRLRELERKLSEGESPEDD